MNLWTIMSPYAEMSFSPGTGAFFPFVSEISALPGVKEKNGVYTIPQNAIRTVQKMVLDHSVEVQGVRWGRSPHSPKEWATIERILRTNGEVKEEAFQLLAPYQKKAISFTWNREGSHLWMPRDPVKP